ncbi:DUF2304 domain-containing protein [Enterococcus sp. LJL90]
MDIFSIVMILVALFFLYFIIRSINKNKFSLENAGIWLTVGIILLIFSVFTPIPTWLSELFGFQLTSNFLLFLAVIFLLLIVFMQSLQLSKQKDQINIIIQELSLLKSKNKESAKDDD